MKIKKLFAAITVSIAAVLGFTACIEGGESKYTASYGSPAVIEYNLSGMFLRTAYGIFVPDNMSALNLAGLSDGDCIYMEFEYNSEYQTGQYPVASNIKHEVTGYQAITSGNQEMIDSTYNYPFSSVELFDESFSPNYCGRFFVLTEAKLDKNQKLSYYFYYKSDELPDANGTRNIYLQAHLPVESTGSENVSEIQALDVRSMARSFGKDTTVTDGAASYSLVYLKVDLKYCSGVETETENLVYKSVSTQPIYIYIYKDDL